MMPLGRTGPALRRAAIPSLSGLSPGAVLIEALCLVLLAGVAAPSAAAEVDLWGTVGLSVYHWSIEGAKPRALGVVDGRLDVRVTSDPWWASLTLEPLARVELAEGGRGSVSLDTTEAFLVYRGDDADLFAGRLNLAVETARLSLPFTLMPPDEFGRRWGVEGVRVDWYTGSNRVQMAAVKDGGLWAPLVSLWHAGAGWEATGHLLFRQRGVAAGIGWSGRVDSIIAYGEVWSLPDEGDVRYSAGASGYLGDVLWTAEFARAPLVPGRTPPMPQAALQLSFLPTDSVSLLIDAAVALDGTKPISGSAGGGGGPAHRWEVMATYELAAGEREIELSVYRWVHPPLSTGLVAGLGVRYFF